MGSLLKGDFNYKILVGNSFCSVLTLPQKDFFQEDLWICRNNLYYFTIILAILSNSLQLRRMYQSGSWMESHKLFLCLWLCHTTRNEGWEVWLGMELSVLLKKRNRRRYFKILFFFYDATSTGMLAGEYLGAWVKGMLWICWTQVHAPGIETASGHESTKLYLTQTGTINILLQRVPLGKFPRLKIC